MDTTQFFSKLFELLIGGLIWDLLKQIILMIIALLCA